jgi:hypothetical protein
MCSWLGEDSNSSDAIWGSQQDARTCVRPFTQAQGHDIALFCYVELEEMDDRRITPGQSGENLIVKIVVVERVWMELHLGRLKSST